MGLLVVGSLLQGFSSQWQDNIRPHLLQYLEFISSDIGTPPDLVAAKRLSQDLNINIYIYGNGINFSSTEKTLDRKNLEFYSERRRWREKNKNSSLQGLNDDNGILQGRISFGEYYDRTILLHEIDDYQIYYELSHQGRRDREFNVIQKSLLILLILLLLGYLLLRRLLRPISDISEGVNTMRTGDLNYRIPVRKDNDLSLLSSSINSMVQEIDEMLDAKRQLLLAVSHELRSPITRAKVALGLMQESSSKGALEQDLDEMEKLISEILEAERVNGPHASLNLEELSSTEILNSVIGEYSPDSLKANINNDLPRVKWDETRIRLLLRNIINNALHYSDNDSPKPEISAESKNGKIEIKVKDYGQGISQQDLTKITEPFYRADPSRTRSTGGFGLGLYLCSQIVKAHKGELLFDSAVDEGTCVTIRLPLV
jgi:signal transduction histidine kinase